MFPEQWQNQFGLPVAEHKRRMQVNIFNGYTVFGINDKKEKLNIEDHNTQEVKNE